MVLMVQLGRVTRRRHRLHQRQQHRYPANAADTNQTVVRLHRYCDIDVSIDATSQWSLNEAVVNQ